MRIDVDVAIVGARIAGAISASLLGEAGHRVALIDATTFPSDTISTHFFRGAGLVSVLRDLGLLDEVLALRPPPLTCEYLFRGRDPTPRVGGPQDPGSLGYCLSVRRLPLDHLLVERARRTPGVHVMEATTARGVVRGDDGRVVGIDAQRGSEPLRITARIVVGADGRGSSIARWLEPPVARCDAAVRAMYFRYLRGYRGPGGSRDGPEFSTIGDELVYAFPSDDDVTCVAISINLAQFAAFRLDPDALFEARVRAHPGIGPRFADAEPVSRVLASGPKDAIVRRASGPGWALVGDSGMSQDPWSGLGMDNASVHATYLAEALDDWLSGRSSERIALDTFERRRDEHALPGYGETVELGRDLSRL